MSLYSLLAKIFEMRYNGGTIGKEVPTVEEKTKKTLSDYGLGVLYYKCKKINHNTLSDVAKHHRLVKALKAMTGEYTDESVCDCLTQCVKESIANGYQSYRMSSVVRRMQRDIYGREDPDCRVKKTELSLDASDPDYGRIMQALSPLNKSNIANLVKTKAFMSRVRNNKDLCTLADMYEAFKDVFFPEIRFGIKKSNNVQYATHRVIAGDFCDNLFNDPNRWHSDYEAYWSGK